MPDWKQLLRRALARIRRPFRLRKSSRPPVPRLALVTCVRNESAWLPAFLSYHHAIGVERAYVYCDRCTDGSAALAASHPWVKVFRLDSAQARRMPYVADFQCACMNHSLQRAREEGFDWLMMIDVDEFAFAHNEGSSARERAHLVPLLQRAKAETVQIRLPTHEIVPMAAPEGAPFWQQRFVQPTPRLTSQVLDPLNNKTHAWSGFFGHWQGKTIVRTSADIQSYDPHRWVPRQSVIWPERPEYVELPTEEMGCHLHYFLTSQHQWRDKFTKQSFEPDVWICGKDVELPKLVWRRAIREMKPDQLDDFFDRRIARDERELQDLAQQGLVEENRDVIEILQATEAAIDPPVFHPISVLQQPPPSRGWGWTATEMPTNRRRGFYGLERHGVDYFRWTEPDAAVKLALPRADYRLRLDMKDLASLWSGQLDLRCNDRMIPCRERTVADGILSQTISLKDLPTNGELWLRFTFDPVCTTSWPGEKRSLGAPIFSLFLDRLQ